MLSIDFGNSFTKVALRPDMDAATVPVKDESLTWDELNLCVPTLAASHERGGKLNWHYGTDVVRLRQATGGLKVHRNWKPRFFEGPAAPTGNGVPLRKPVAAIATGELPPPPGMTAEAWDITQAELPSAQATALWERLGGAAGSTAPAEGETDPDHKQIGFGFFRWLRTFVDPVCRRQIGRAAAEIPVRVSLPSFSSMAGAELLLRDILEEAGWKLDDRTPTLREPLSNAIGTFTKGANVTHRNRTAPHYGQMFQNTGMLARMRAASLGNKQPKTAWVLVVDVGGYTADFAMVGLDLEDIDAHVEGQIDGKPRLAHMSKPLGVTDLDQRVRRAIPEEKRAALDAVIADPDQQRLEAFHKGCFGHRGQHVLKWGVAIGETAAEKGNIRDTIGRFAEEVADDAEGFLSVHQYDRIDDLILTGGGTLIPAVRDALCSRLNYYGVQKVHTYLTDGEPPPPAVAVHRLGYELVRGATAIGGASVYFDFAGG
jgi:hypothetical protein